MALFGRRGQEPAALPVPAFWAWWAAEGAAGVEAASDAGDAGALVGLLGERVTAIDPGLDWEVGPGTAARSSLTVSAAGDATLRRVAERWRRAGPADDHRWEFRPARAADPGFVGHTLRVSDVPVAFADARVAIDADPERTRVGVTVFHPAFAALDERARGTATFLMLDAALGEDAVERWLAHVAPSTDPVGHDDLVALCNAVDRLAARRPAQETWTLAMSAAGGADGARAVPVGVRTDQWARWLDHPLYGLHTALTLKFAGDERGLPPRAEQDRLVAAEETVVAGTAGTARLVTVVTTAGTRTFHLYSDAEDQNVTASLRSLAKTIGAKATQEPDPTWSLARVLD